MTFDTNMALWHVTHPDNRSAIVRAESGPLAMQMLGWRAASFEMLTVAGGAEIVIQAPAPKPVHSVQQHIEVLNEGLDDEDYLNNTIVEIEPRHVPSLNAARVRAILGES